MNYKIWKTKLDEPVQKRFATGENYAVLMVLRGTAHIRGIGSMTSDDLLVCKPRQVVFLDHPGGHYPVEVVWAELSRELLRSCSTEETDVLFSFEVNPEAVARVRGRSEILMLLKSLSAQVMGLEQEKERYAMDLLEESSVKMFLALVIRACVQSDLRRVRKGTHLALDEVFRYIHAHLTEEISLEQLEREFYVSRHHLIRQFKLRTGQTVHQYIIKNRLDRCRKLIEQGYSITEVCRLGGFGSYNHFFRTFKQEYHMTPKQYYRAVQEAKPDGSQEMENKGKDS